MENIEILLKDHKGNSLGVTSDIPASLLKEGFIVEKNGQKYEVTKWFYSLDEDRIEGVKQKLTVVLREIKLPWFAKNQDRQVFIGYLFVSPTIVFFVGSLLLYFFQPTLFWACIGLHIRGFISFGLILTGIVLSLQIKNGIGSDRPTILGTYLFLLFPPLGMIAAIVWSQVSLPPVPPNIWPDDYVKYVDFLRTKFKDVWPILFGVVPWIVFLLNIFGLQGAAKFFELVSKQTKSS
jgi:hypothetical protein